MSGLSLSLRALTEFQLNAPLLFRLDSWRGCAGIIQLRIVRQSNYFRIERARVNGYLLIKGALINLYIYPVSYINFDAGSSEARLMSRLFALRVPRWYA